MAARWASVLLHPLLYDVYMNVGETETEKPISAYLSLVKVHPIHREFFGVLQKHQVCLSWTHYPAKRKK